MAAERAARAALPSRILVRGVNWLGDAVMTTPALARVREAFPAAHITLLTAQKLAELWLAHPAVNEVLTFAPGASPWSVAAHLRQGRFDLALVLPNSPRSAFETWLARIPRRIGYARPWRNWWLTQCIPGRPGQVRMRKRSAREVARLVAAKDSPPPELPKSVHQIHEYLHLAAVGLGTNPEPFPPQVYLTASEMEVARVKWFDRLGRDRPATVPAGETVFLGLNPSAAYGPAKRWPVEHFAATAAAVSRVIPKCTWLVFGSASDATLGEEIVRRAGPSTVNLAGQTSLRELMALLKGCRVLLTNDSGPMHLAAALGTSVVVPFGSTSPELTGPGLPGDPRHHLLRAGVSCAPCFRRQCPIDLRCLTRITPARAAEAVLAALESSERPHC